jgi:hypothetical protein
MGGSAGTPIPSHVPEVYDPAFEDAESALRVERLQVIAESDLYASDSSVLQVLDCSADDLRADAPVLVLRVNGQIQQEAIRYTVTQD